MPRPICHCELCGASSADVIVDVYNDFDGQPGNLICDPCILADMIPGPDVIITRPEGYYHCAPGTFD